MLENIELLYSTFIIIFDLDNVCTAKDLYIVEIFVQIYSSLVQLTKYIIWIRKETIIPRNLRSIIFELFPFCYKIVIDSFPYNYALFVFRLQMCVCFQ